MILEMLTNYLSESGNFNLYFDSSIEDIIKQKIDKEDLDINNLKGNTDLETEDWNKIGEILSDINLNNDYILKNLMEKLETEINPHFYSLIIKGLCSLIEKGISIDKINFIFKNSNEIINIPYEEKIQSYQAFCQYNPNEDILNTLETVDYIKDSKKKKPIKAPEFDNEFKNSKYFNKTPDHNVLIYDKIAEIVVRNKILENCIKSINTEIDTKPIFKRVNEVYDELLSTSDIYNMIQFYSYQPNEFTPAENNDSENI